MNSDSSNVNVSTFLGNKWCSTIVKYIFINKMASAAIAVCLKSVLSLGHHFGLGQWESSNVVTFFLV